MNSDIKNFLNRIGLPFDDDNELEDQIVPRDMFLDQDIYKELYSEIPILKSYLKSSNNTCLHKNAEANQRWPLLNITRQILKNYNYKMIPIRKAEGYTEDGAKIYKRYFIIAICNTKQYIAETDIAETDIAETDIIETDIIETDITETDIIECDISYNEL
jgi:hypothetical protein